MFADTREKCFYVDGRTDGRTHVQTMTYGRNSSRYRERLQMVTQQNDAYNICMQQAITNSTTNGWLMLRRCCATQASNARRTNEYIYEMASERSTAFCDLDFDDARRRWFTSRCLSAVQKDHRPAWPRFAIAGSRPLLVGSKLYNSYIKALYFLLYRSFDLTMKRMKLFDELWHNVTQCV